MNECKNSKGEQHLICFNPVDLKRSLLWDQVTDDIRKHYSGWGMAVFTAGAHTLTPALRSGWRCGCSCFRTGCTRGTQPTPADPVYELLLRNQTDGEPEPRVCSAAWSNSPNRPHLWRSETHESFRKHIQDWLQIQAQNLFKWDQTEPWGIFFN